MATETLRLKLNVVEAIDSSPVCHAHQMQDILNDLSLSAALPEETCRLFRELLEALPDLTGSNPDGDCPLCW